jgi:hypothetical protein
MTIRCEVSVGTVSWISGEVNPVDYGAEAKIWDPEWLVKTYIGLVATANARPPQQIGDFRTFQNGKDFRALIYCRCQLDVDEATDRVTRFQVADALHDPGWTPPFRIRKYPSTIASFDGDIYSNAYHQGEASRVSVVRTQARHANTTLASTPATEQILVNGLIKFRAGAHTDNIGINTVRAPFHVPWVWSEMLLTYARRTLKLYGRGSIFPSHAWYLNGTQVKKVNEIADDSFPLQAACISRPSYGFPMAPSICVPTNNIAVELTNIYRVLRVGAPSNGPQAGDNDNAGAVDSHRYTAPAGIEVSHTEELGVHCQCIPASAA